MLEEEKEGVFQKAIFGAGCFWHVEEVFNKINGVKSTEVGYCGGILKNPTYEDVCSGKTGHVEVVKIEYNPVEVSYEELLDLFWKIHDPTSLNRQGPDVGEQYRSIIFCHNEEQEIVAKASKEKLQKSSKLDKDVVTEITSSSEFYRAEEYHQQYYGKRGLTHVV